MSQLRMLLASAAAAVAIAFIGPLLWGAAPALAQGPQVHTDQQTWRNNNHRNDGDHDRDDRRLNQRRNDGDHDRDDRRFNQRRFDQDDFCRRDPDDCRSHRFNNYNCYCAQSQPVYQPCYCAQPVYYAQPTYAYTAPSYYWMNYGRNWNYNMSYGQVQQVCGDYNSAYAYSTSAYNAYVAGVCVSISVSGNTVTIQITP